MSIALLFPPAVDPRAPHLALPSLAASLAAQGVAVELFDCNVQGMRYLLEPERMRQACAALRDRMRGRWDFNTPEGLLALYASKVSEGISDALAILADPIRFFDANAFGSARELVVAGLAIHAAARHPDLRYDIMPPRYEVKGIDPRRLADLISVSATSTYNLFEEHWNEWLFPALAVAQPEIVGVTITNRQQLIPGLTLCRRLRKAGYFTVIGGTVFSKFTTELSVRPTFFEHFADAVMVYEGETALLTLLDELRGARRFSRVPNLLFVENGRVQATRTLVEDVNVLPTPDFSGLDLKAYLAPHPVLPILTGKGCYFNRCKFCDIPFINHISRKAYRLRDVELIAADINALATRFNCRHFLITDEALSPRLLVKLAEALAPMKERGYSFTGYARLEAGFTLEVCRTLRAMGLRKLYFGLESANQATLDHMDKGTNADDAAVVLHNCATAGINFHLFSIIGFPQESAESARGTCDFLLSQQALLDCPGNSFDMHPFGLELRTDYFHQREKFQIEIAPEVLETDFAIGVHGGEWRNRGGLESAEVERLLGEEFYPRLRAAYQQYHATPDGIWPGFEEYAGLYAAYYDGRDFPFCTSLSGLRPGQTAVLNWSSALAVIRHEHEVLLVNRRGFMRITQPIFLALDGLRVGEGAAALREVPFGEGVSLIDRLGFVNGLIAQCFLVASRQLDGADGIPAEREHKGG